MKKMKCASCGAELIIEDDKEYAVCEHCGSKYKLNEDVNINIKMDDNVKDIINHHFGIFNKFSKLVFIPIFIFVLVVIISIVAFIFTSKNTFDDVEKNKQKFEESFEEGFNKAQDQGEKYLFNFQFSVSAGTKTGHQLENILDTIIESNKINDKKVTLVYDGDSIIDENRIIEIKHNLSNWDNYEVVVNYDDDGFVNEIKVDKID